MLTIAKNHKNLEKNGRPFFWLADTCWSAFTNISDQEWEYYLDKRKKQGFNTLQINILPQWDASSTRHDWKPFIDGDPHQLNDEYFAHARAMAKRAREKGFELALVVLWCNYVPGTWASKIFRTGILPFDAIAPYVEKVHETFSDLDPVYVISGDTDFPEKETEDYYLEAARVLRPLVPDHLLTTHIKGRYSYIPKDLEDMLDLHFYQSGHNAKDRTMPWSLSEKMQELYPGKPLLNSEPCYEDMGWSGGQYGRWHRDDIRKAAWQSLLSGASAGITYGAAGIYSWQQADSNFATGLGEGFDKPKAWQDAMNFPGAWDYSLARRILEGKEITPRQDLLANETGDIRVAIDQDETLYIYVPYNTALRLNGDFTDRNFTVIDLENRFISDGDPRQKDGKTIVEMHPFNADALIIAPAKKQIVKN